MDATVARARAKASPFSQPWRRPHARGREGCAAEWGWDWATAEGRRRTRWPSPPKEKKVEHQIKRQRSGRICTSPRRVPLCTRRRTSQLRSCSRSCRGHQGPGSRHIPRLARRPRACPAARTCLCSRRSGSCLRRCSSGPRTGTCACGQRQTCLTRRVPVQRAARRAASAMHRRGELAREDGGTRREEETVLRGRLVL